jgi:hypothetical protein
MRYQLTGQVFSEHSGCTEAAEPGCAFGHVGDRDTAVFRHHERLSFNGETCHFINDGLFLTAIETQVYSLKWFRGFGFRLCLSALCSATNCFQISFKIICSGTAICVGFLIKCKVFNLAHQRSRMTCCERTSTAHHIKQPTECKF